MRTPSLVLVALVLTALPGCYLWHGLEGDDGVVPPTPTPPPSDASLPTPVDAGSAPTPIPAEPDPDLGPDARPSDYPDADDWDDVPEVDELDDCCELDDPILVGSRDTGLALHHEAPAIAWGPGRWGLVVTRTVTASGRDDPRPLVFELAADGAVLGAARELDRQADPAPIIRWAEGRWAIAVGGEATRGDERALHVRLYDRDFRPAGEWQSVGTSPLRQRHLARLTSGDTWLAVRNVGASLAVTAFREGLVEAPVEYPDATGRTLGAVGLRSRVAVLMGGSEEPNRVIVLGAGRSHEVIERVPLTTRYVEDATITALRDLVVVAGIEAGQVRVEVVDPFAGVVVAGSRAITDASDAVARAIDAIGSSKHGLAGVCNGIGTDDGSRGAGTIDFRLVGPDGVPRGRAVRVVESAFRGGMVNCAVGTDDEGFLVAWWDGSALWVRRVRVPRTM